MCVCLYVGTTATLAAYKSSTVTNICRQLGVDSFTFADQECSAQPSVGSAQRVSLQSLGVCDGANLLIQAPPNSTKLSQLSEAGSLLRSGGDLVPVHVQYATHVAD